MTKEAITPESKIKEFHSDLSKLIDSLWVDNNYSNPDHGKHPWRGPFQVIAVEPKIVLYNHGTHKSEIVDKEKLLDPDGEFLYITQDFSWFYPRKIVSSDTGVYYVYAWSAEYIYLNRVDPLPSNGKYTPAGTDNWFYGCEYTYPYFINHCKLSSNIESAIGYLVHRCLSQTKQWVLERFWGSGKLICHDKKLGKINKKWENMSDHRNMLRETTAKDIPCNSDFQTLLDIHKTGIRFW